MLLNSEISQGSKANFLSGMMRKTMADAVFTKVSRHIVHSGTKRYPFQAILFYLAVLNLLSIAECFSSSSGVDNVYFEEDFFPLNYIRGG